VSVVVDQAYPGAVVLLHNGGGDRSQTVEALEKILETLSSQGYVFEVVCP
jgi:peptidoglycan/xylan/chitin deacetylase (PgdA/CDA1 family)